MGISADEPHPAASVAAAANPFLVAGGRDCRAVAPTPAPSLMLLAAAMLAVDVAALGSGFRASARPPRARAVNVVRALRRDTSAAVADLVEVS